MKTSLFPRKLKNLHESLRNFGLDPREWQLQPIGEESMLIQHLHDPELALKGQIYSMGHRWHWQEIRVSAI